MWMSFDRAPNPAIRKMFWMMMLSPNEVSSNVTALREQA
jgi:hypothetical protein